MKKSAILLGLASLPLVFQASAQVTISGADMFNQAGEYYRAYSNLDGISVSVASLIQAEGGPRTWNFMTGPQDQVFRFDYFDPQNTVIGFEFPQANIAERKTDEDGGDQSWLLFRQVPNVGRRVYGFYDPEFNPANPPHVFDPPIVDFPDRIQYLDSWTTSMSFHSDYVVSDDFIFPLLISQNSEFKVDAYGFLGLPGGIGFVETLRVNELVVTSVAMDILLDGNFVSAGTDYRRNFYWLAPGKGIAAQINGEPSPNPPSSTINLASFFLRMFETNKVPREDPCQEPKAIENLSIEISNGLAILSWTKVDCASSYRVEYSEGGLAATDWKVLGEPTDQDIFVDSNVQSKKTRYYRVVSLR